MVKLKLKYYVLLWLIVCICWVNGFSQTSVNIVYVIDSCDIAKLPIDSTATFLNNQLANEHLTKQHQNLLNDGYFEASVDSVINNEQQVIAYLNIGNKYNGITLNTSNLPVKLKEYLNLNKTQNSTKLNLSEWNNINTQILRYAENNGHPFATINLTNTAIENKSINACIEYTPNQTIQFDSLLVKGDAKLNSAFLQNLLATKHGDEFKAEKLKEIYQTLEDLPYIEQYRKPAVEFLSSGANVLLFVNDKKANQFDFVLGLLPQTEGLKLTGEGQFTLNNAFGFGERLHLNYTNLPNSGRQLDIEAKAIYLPYLPIGLNLDFNLYIQDSLFINRNFKSGVLYPFKANNYFEVYFANDQSRLLEIDADKIIQTKQLPENLDLKTTKYGLHFHLENYNYRFNPTKGFGIDFNVSAGRRTISKNNRITELVDTDDTSLNFEHLYDSLALKTTKFEVNAKIEKYFKIKTNSTLKTAINFAYFYTSGSFESVYENELYRIGGLRTLRGFDEASILGNLYSLHTVEYRYLIAKQSFFSCFVNAAFIENQKLKLSTEKYNRLFYSAGLGLNFETSSGVFSLNYALGKKQYNNINIKAGKIHFGYLNVF